ncbi:lipoyl(octanoyl) transferase [Paragonimus westermani]|uniref:lipoyl(octanoyl) transferase n=1 Tax=Paragonimus westermani TaxID=34504 RepID=A0A5J4N756_9TREM|nr:lipoyl(octanoyl) transferase [Paragonimus westermani]
MSSVTCFFLGRVHYTPSLVLQKAIVHLLKAARNPFQHTILMLEHCPVYTVGVRSRDPENDYSKNGIAKLERLGAEFVKTDRGGLITYHGPGQLVAYPIINLRCKSLIGRGLRWYIGALEHAGVCLCEQFGLEATPGGRGDVGVWLSPSKKIMAIGESSLVVADIFIALFQPGIHQSESITYHGLALNCSNEPLDWLRIIVPCGLAGRDVTSLAEVCQRNVTIDEVIPQFAVCLINSLFGPEESRPTDFRVSFRNDLAADWSGTCPSVSKSTSPLPHSWTEASNVILEEVKFRTLRPISP